MPDLDRDMPYHNEGLFTDHYLRAVLPGGDMWRLDGLDEFATRVGELWATQGSLVEGYSEALLEHHFVRPVLDLLGHVWEPQAPVAERQPDYAFFADEAGRMAALPADGARRYWQSAIAVGDAKAWDRKLDRPLAGGRGWDFANPTFQIYYYLAQTRCRWGILTNGRLWRLVPGAPQPDIQAYYEVDVPAALSSEDPSDLAYFWLVFRREAFVPGDDGKTFLERVKAGSDEAAEKLREDVRKNVYEALVQTCRGFDEETVGETNLGEVFDSSLVLLYRLLFILYAESAGLLPVRGGGRYQQHYSLSALKHEVAERGTDGYSRRAHRLWQWLLDLFRAVDSGDPDLEVMAYNGGLFDACRHPFLETHRLSDRRVATVIDLLARTAATQSRSEAPEKRFVDYRDLGVRHLGSIYEGLLEYRLSRAREPMVAVKRNGREVWAPESMIGAADRVLERCPAHGLYLATDKGERKATGSYYTPEFIVEYIVEHALGRAIDACDSEEEVLALKVLDPAMGSAHFLVEATGFIARRLFERAGHAQAEGNGRGSHQDEPELARLRRLVVERCIYGVDLNPLAVELAKLSLWLATVAQGQPLSFLDHHLRCGDSLIGARAAELPAPPPDAGAKRANERHALAQERAAAHSQYTLFDADEFTRHATQLLGGLGEISTTVSDSREAVRRKGAVLRTLEEEHRRRYKELADLWCSRRFGCDYDDEAYSELVAYLQGRRNGLSEGATAVLECSRKAADRLRFFHWDLEFPEAFLDAHGAPSETPGFDVVVGNPPWERIKLQENEFFARRDPGVAFAPTAAARGTLITELRTGKPELAAEYERAKEDADLKLAWMRDSGLYPLTAHGDTNYYTVMTERMLSLLHPGGYCGIVVPSGIATDDTTKALFGDLVERRRLRALLDFENKRAHFHELHRSFKYSIVVMSERGDPEPIRCAFFLHNPEDMEDDERVFSLGPSDFELFNPNTRTCPVFRSRRDAELTRAVYERAPILVRERPDGEDNPWGLRYATMFHMTNDSGLFRTAEELDRDGFWPSAANVWRKRDEAYLPLYEGKMVQMYDHRAASVRVNPENVHRPSVPEPSTDDQLADPGYSPAPQFWVSEEEVSRRTEGWARRWAIAFKDATAPTNARTMIAAAVPLVGMGNTLPALLLSGERADRPMLLLGNLCSIALDYTVRQKVGGQHLNEFIVKQLPVLPPERYEQVWNGSTVAELVIPRVLELSYTAYDMAPLAVDLGHVDGAGEPLPPFPWDPERRLHLQCQLDAIYFLLYGLSREDAEYVLETFPIVKRKDESAYGRYRTRELVVEYLKAFSAGDFRAWVNR